MTYEDIVVSKQDGIGLIRLNRPKVLNALSKNLYQEVDDAVYELESDDEIKVLVFTGTGERAFSGGADIHEQVRDAESPPPYDPRRAEQAWNIAATSKPTIGALNGLCYGGGAVMASSFDIRIGCERTSFRFLAASYGRVNSTWTLPLQVGWPKAKELLLTARVVNAKEAYHMGLLNHLVEAEQLMDKSMELAEQIAGNDARMVQGIKNIMVDDIGLSWRGMHDNEASARQGKLAATPVEEGFSEFIARKGRKN